MSVTVYIGFGSNLGDPLARFHQAKTHLLNLPATALLRISPLYRSEPLTLGGETQPWYLNAVFEMRTALGPSELFSQLKKIETLMGRTRRRKWAPRIVDLDILFYGDMIYADQALNIPHLELHRRLFVLKPLCDLAPRLLHPEFDMTVAELLELSDDTLVTEPLDPPAIAGAI